MGAIKNKSEFEKMIEVFCNGIVQAAKMKDVSVVNEREKRKEILIKEDKKIKGGALCR